MLVNRPRLISLVLAAALVAPAVPALAVVGANAPVAAAPSLMPQAPEVAARAFILQDLSTGQTLASRLPDQAVEPASLTKLMTAYLVFQALQSGKLQLAQDVPVSERAWRTGMTGASRTFIKVNSRVNVDDLIKGVIVQSGNDATVALAEAVGGSVEVFVEMMNRQAQAFGLKATTFRNPEGLTAPGHTTTARELSVIATRLITDFPQSLPYYSMKEFTFNGIKQPNRNLLLYRDPTVDGLKTGYTDAAGYCLISTAKRPVPGGGTRRLLSVVLGTGSDSARAMESQKLLNYGFQFFETVKLYPANQAVSSLRIYKGKGGEVKAGFLSDFHVTVPRGMSKNIQAQLVTQQPLLAPVRRGQKLGTLRLSVDGQPVGDYPLLALENVPVAGILGRGWDNILLMFK